MIKVALFEDNPDLRNSLYYLLSGTEGMHVTGAFNNCSEIEGHLEREFPDVLLMDIDMPEVNGLEGLNRAKTVAPHVYVLMLTVFEDNEHIFEAICNGANGYLLKKTSPAKIIEAIQDVVAGGAPMTSTVARKVLQLFSKSYQKTADTYDLTPREREVLGLLVDGCSYKMITAKMFVSLETVRSHIKNIYEKLQVHSKSEAVAMAIKNRIV